MAFCTRAWPVGEWVTCTSAGSDGEWACRERSPKCVRNCPCWFRLVWLGRGSTCCHVATGIRSHLQLAFTTSCRRRNGERKVVCVIPACWPMMLFTFFLISFVTIPVSYQVWWRSLRFWTHQYEQQGLLHFKLGTVILAHAIASPPLSPYLDAWLSKCRLDFGPAGASIHYS